jgi:DNA-3-methyladenine glycosylase I
MMAGNEHVVPCSWAPIGDSLYRAYHDIEWGVPVRDSRALWEKLQLDGMQAGLAWITILRKRGTICEEFDDFDPERIACWDERRIEVALRNPGIIRCRRKVEAVVGNARAFLEAAQRGEDFSRWLWDYVGGRPIQNRVHAWREGPTKSEISERISRALRSRGYAFCGPVIVYAFMQAVGMVNDHELSCRRRAEVAAMAANGC